MFSSPPDALEFPELFDETLHCQQKAEHLVSLARVDGLAFVPMALLYLPGRTRIIEPEGRLAIPCISEQESGCSA